MNKTLEALRPIIVHSYEHACAAFDAAHTLRIDHITLQSARDAIFYAGSLYLHHMIEHAQANYPEIGCTFILDCSDNGAIALESMQMGFTHLKSSATPEIIAQLKQEAIEHGVELMVETGQPIDLAIVSVARDACMAWLSAKD